LKNSCHSSRANLMQNLLCLVTPRANWPTVCSCWSALLQPTCHQSDSTVFAQCLHSNAEQTAQLR
jgi:hypothetical protein